jgi:hypothetical protein
VRREHVTYISKKRREKSAVVHSGKKAKFPVDSVQTAKSAEKLINTAKPALSSGQKAAIHRKTAKFGVEPNKNPGKGETKKRG